MSTCSWLRARAHAWKHDRTINRHCRHGGVGIDGSFQIERQTVSLGASTSPFWQPPSHISVGDHCTAGTDRPTDGGPTHVLEEIVQDRNAASGSTG